MAGRNGLATLPVARKPLRVVPETRPVEIDTGEETITLTAYVKGPGCLIEILAEVDGAVADWEDNLPSEAERTSLKPRRWLAKHNAAERMLRRDILVRVIPGLSMEHANVMAADGGLWHDLLVDLGWWADPTPDDEAEAAADPEATAPADAPTGADDSPASSPATPEPTLSS